MSHYADAPIPQADPARRIARFWPSIADAIHEVAKSGSLVLGPKVSAFEQAFAGYIGASQCVGVNSGTDALALALRASGVKPGDEVITVALTAAGTGQAILHCGATPRFVDVDPVTFCMDPAAAEAAISSRTVAIVPVHLYGRAADVMRLHSLADRHGLALIEDCAQCHGASLAGRRLGTFGHAAAFSFYPTKNLGALGDGGAVITDDPSLAERVRSLRAYGWSADSRISQRLGFNSRLDEVQAAVLLVLLEHLDKYNADRREIAAQYRTMLASCGADMSSDDPGCVYHQFAITHPQRNALARHLADDGIGTAVHYNPPLQRHPAFATQASCALPITDSLSARLLSLPIQPEIASGNVERIAEAVRRFGPQKDAAR
ncbi:DegT/DnrJ/EryC1/StrS family aminotransferase [Methylobacterium sp. WL9]|uniref:DegT/DnrJ/EryC1/StrS family aminotransferase n=1 Tax=Methylobacterium sp. WL9 TaxID=2603898 RepID=UPI0011C82B56|nr:DegT/DnrJ/EryC1/StrS family aminotransferase [Methylobacterium sp. WL9]TXN22704.1 DegT/DnrJ/EryC1/StrS family aminotransferase [Methylobacterium sp. WL9]